MSYLGDPEDYHYHYFFPLVTNGMLWLVNDFLVSGSCPMGSSGASKMEREWKAPICTTNEVQLYRWLSVDVTPPKPSAHTHINTKMMMWLFCYLGCWLIATDCPSLSNQFKILFCLHRKIMMSTFDLVNNVIYFNIFDHGHNLVAAEVLNSCSSGYSTINMAWLQREEEKVLDIPKRLC